MTFTRRSILAFAALAALAFGTATSASAAGIAPLDDATKELVLGNPKSPVEVVEYASLSCPHCKHFHDEIYAPLKKKYIDTGKIKFVYRDFPTNSAGLAASMIARCAGSKRLPAMVDMFFQTQKTWAYSDKPLDELTKIARMAGIGPKEVDECVRNEALMKSIQASAENAVKKYDVRGTPTIFVNGKQVERFMELDAVEKIIDEALAKAK